VGSCIASTPVAVSSPSVASVGVVDSSGGVATKTDVLTVSDSSGIHSEGVSSMAPSSSLSSMSSCFLSPLASSEYGEDKTTETSGVGSAGPVSLVPHTRTLEVLESTQPSASLSAESNVLVAGTPAIDLIESSMGVASEPNTLVSSEPSNVVSSEPSKVVSSEPSNVVSSEPSNVVSSEPSIVVSSKLNTLVSSELEMSSRKDTGQATLSSVCQVKCSSFSPPSVLPSLVTTPISAGVIATPNLTTPPTYVSTNFAGRSPVLPSQTNKLTTPSVTVLPIESHSPITLTTPTSLPSGSTPLPTDSSNGHKTIPSVNASTHSLPVHLTGSSIPSPVDTSLFMAPQISAPLVSAQVSSRSPSLAVSKQHLPAVSQQPSVSVARHPSLPPPSPQPQPVVIRSSSTPPVSARIEHSDVNRSVTTITNFKCCWSSCERWVEFKN